MKIRNWYSITLPIERKRLFLKYALKSAKLSHTWTMGPPWAMQEGQVQVPMLAHGLQGQQKQCSKNHSRVLPWICDGFKLRV